MRGIRSFIFLALCVSCLEPYLPPETSDALNALVVDGSISTDGNARVRLSRSIPLASNSYTPSERSATVTISSSRGEIYSLTEGDSAVYTATGLAVSIDETFVLSIRTANGNEYRSDEVQIYTSPPIDKVHFGISATGEDIEVLVDAHDSGADATGYYLWDCTETYEYRAPVYSGFRFVNKVAIERKPGEQVYKCWRDEVKPSVMLSTKFLTENVINAKRISTINRLSPKLSVRYSALISQRSISEEEYNYRTELQKSTEQQGSLFAVIPGSVVGNIHSLTSPGEFVLGYFRGQHIQQQRFFIERVELPKYFQVPQSMGACSPELTCRFDQPKMGPSLCVDATTLGDEAIITNVLTDGRGVPVGYYFTTSDCGDCRVKGGTTTPPAFW